MEPPLPGIKLHPGEEMEKAALEKTEEGSNINSGAEEEEKEPHPDHQPEENGGNENNVVLTPEPEPDAPMWSMVSASPRGGSGILSSSTEGFSRTPDWVMSTANSSPMKSPPPLQAMGRGYDPNRIPASIFSSKPATPMDWSVASNESLFSIHMGNNSFSREMGLGLDDDPGCFTPNLDPVVETPRKSDVDTPRKSDVETPRKSNVYVRPGLEDDDDDQDLAETPKMARKETGGADHGKDKMAALGPIGVRLSNSSTLSDGKAPRVSNESAKSSDSFAFPVLFGGTDGKGGSIKTPAERSPRTPEAQGSPNPEKTEPAPPAQQAAGPASWFSCGNCCPAWMRCC